MIEDFVKEKTERYLEYLRAWYPHKEISEYTRLVDALETFIAYGCWESEDEEK